MAQQVNVNTNGTGTGVGSGWAIKNGVIGGIIAGIVLAMADIIAAWVSMGQPIAPLQMIAGVPLQRDPTTIDQGTAIVVGVLTHMLLSIVFGVIVAYVVASVPALYNSPVATVIFATLVGFILWPLDFYVIGPAINAPWFRDKTDPVQQFIWHTFMYGTVLGLYLASRLPRTVTATTRQTNL